jgi:SHS2 domain-containing protein
MGYRFIDHTADVAADLTGETLEELFLSAAEALTDTMTELSGVGSSVKQSVTLEAGTVEDLLVDWLNELLYRFEVRNMLVATASLAIEGDAARDSGWHLEATTSGELFDPERHPSRVLVKSATYHGLHVVREGATWTARIVFDI